MDMNAMGDAQEKQGQGMTPQEQIKYKSLYNEAKKKIGEEKLSELLDLVEKSEDENDQWQPPEGMGPAGSKAGKVYPEGKQAGLPADAIQ